MWRLNAVYTLGFLAEERPRDAIVLRQNIYFLSFLENSNTSFLIWPLQERMSAYNYAVIKCSTLSKFKIENMIELVSGDVNFISTDSIVYIYDVCIIFGFCFCFFLHFKCKQICLVIALWTLL